MKYFLLACSLVFMQVSFSWERPTAGAGTIQKTADKAICNYESSQDCQTATNQASEVDNEVKSTYLYQAKTSDSTQ